MTRVVERTPGGYRAWKQAKGWGDAGVFGTGENCVSHLPAVVPSMPGLGWKCYAGVHGDGGEGSARERQIMLHV